MTAATMPRIKAADEPVRTGALFDGADVVADEGIRVADDPLLVLVVMALKL